MRMASITVESTEERQMYGVCLFSLFESQLAPPPSTPHLMKLCPVFFSNRVYYVSPLITNLSFYSHLQCDLMFHFTPPTTLG